MVKPAIAKQIEDSQSALIDHYCLAIDNAGLNGQAHHGVHDQREPISKVIAVSSDKLNPITVFPRKDAKPVMLDLVKSSRSRLAALRPCEARQGSNALAARLRRRRNSR
jgi:hypothetical protein